MTGERIEPELQTADGFCERSCFPCNVVRSPVASIFHEDFTFLSLRMAAEKHVRLPFILTTREGRQGRQLSNDTLWHSSSVQIDDEASFATVVVRSDLNEM